MPANNTITPLLGGSYYHIFNRGINRGILFFQPKNYEYFLSLWKKYLNECVEVLAYCLLPNHFHFLIKLSEKIEIKSNSGEIQLIESEGEIGELVSERLRRLFISYSQAINKQEQRTGGLFVRNFKRIEIEDEEHLKYLFFYIHFNPEKHTIGTGFKNYKYSSYNAYISNKSTSISKTHGLELFDGIDGILNFHNYYHEEKEKLILE